MVATFVLLLRPLHEVFDVVPMTPTQIGAALGLALVPAAVTEIAKALRRRAG